MLEIEGLTLNYRTGAGPVGLCAVASAKVVWDYLGKQGCYLKTSADYYPNLGLNQPASADWSITAPASCIPWRCCPASVPTKG